MKPLTKLQVIELYLEESNLAVKTKLDFIAVYSNMKDSIKDLKTIKQISIVFAALGVAYDASSAAYQHLIDYSKGLEEKSKLIKELPWEVKMGIGDKKFEELLKSDIQVIKNLSND